MNLTYCKNQWAIPLFIVGVFLASAILFISVAKAVEEAQIQAAIEDLSSATGQDITSEDQAKALCNQEQYLDVCADIGKNHDLYTPEELKHVDDFLGEVKGKILDDIKSCPDEECLVRVASELATKIRTKNPTLATDLNLTTKIVAEKQSVVDAAKEAGVNFKDCESMDPDTASVDLLRKCAKLAKDTRVQKYIPEEKRVLADQFGDTTIKLREALSVGKYQCGDGTLEGCGNYCLNPDAATRAAGIPAVCTQIAKEIFGQEGVKQLESAHQHVGQVKDYYSKKFILTLPNGSELVGEGQIRNACDQAFSGRNLEIARACGSFAVNNGFASQAEVEKGLKLMESFTQKGQNANFDQCLTNPTACREFIPENDRAQFDAGNQIFEIMRTEIGFDPSQCERGTVDQAIGTKCFEGSKRALAKIESLGLANQSREARFIIADIKSHVSEGDNLMRRKDEFKQVFSQQGGPGGCKSEAECFAYCSNPTNGPECISFGAKQNISGFRGQEAVQRFQEYNHNIQKPGLVSDEYISYPSPGGPYPQYPGQGPYPGFPPGQDPRFTQPGPGFSPPPGTAPYYPPYPAPGPVGPSPECFAAIQSGDFVKAKTACSSSGPSIPFPTGQICPASPYIECPAGQYHESFRNSDGCWVDGPCKPAPTYSPGPYPTYTPAPSCPSGQWWDYARNVCTSSTTTYTPVPSCPSGQGWDYTLNKCSTGACGPGYYWDSATFTCKINDSTTSYTPAPSCPSGQWWEYTRNMCVSTTTTYTPAPSCPSGQWWDYTQNKCSSSTSPYPTGPYPTYTSGTSCSQSLINLLGTGCHQMYSDSSGKYIFCNGEMTNSAKEGDTAITAGCSSGSGTYSPYPSPSYTPPGGGACPAGYHYHSESGGFCINDQENYGGTCYNAAGTSKITCPAQASYTPVPSCPSGQWWDYAKNMCVSTTTTYTPAPSCPAGQWWDTATNVCKSTTTTTYTPYPSCPSGQWWDTATSSCKSSTSTGYCGNYVCDSGETSATCPGDCGGGTTYTPYPTSTYTYTPPPTCPSTQYWNGTSCVDNVTTTYTPYPTTTFTSTPAPAPTMDPATDCASHGGTWSGSTCVYPSHSSTTDLYNHHMVAHCQQLGRTWNGKVCQANGLFARFYENNLANVLRLFYIVP